MKKLFICFLFSLFLYGCSEINEPVQVNQNNTVSKIIYNQDKTIQNKKIIPDTTRIIILCDSTLPPLNFYRNSDSTFPPGPGSLSRENKTVTPEK